MQRDFELFLEELLEKHLPVSFLDYEMLMNAKEFLCKREYVGRKEILILAYLIGADSKESNELLRLTGHPLLYVKRREDAIWKFVLDHRVDSQTVINEIFLQNMDEVP